jgi:hypothetical protein
MRVKANKKKATKKKLIEKLKESPINYFSDLFIIAMVVFWIVDNVYESIIASIVTISSVIISVQSQSACYDTSMWSSIGSNVAIPLSCGGAIWMVKNSVQHAIAYSKGKRAIKDFPSVDGASNEELSSEELLQDSESLEDVSETEAVEESTEEVDESGSSEETEQFG